MTNKKRFFTTNLEENDDENSKVAPVECAESFPGIRLDRNQTTMGTKSAVAVAAPAAMVPAAWSNCYRKQCLLCMS